MLAVLKCLTAPLSHASKSQDLCLCLRRASLLLILAFGLGGCQARSVAPATPVAPARSLTDISPEVGKVQSTPLYQQARQACTRHDYHQAASLLETLSKTPGLAPEAVAFVQQQRHICLQDAGETVPAATPRTSAPALTPADADCGPRALLLLCQNLGVKTNLETLRKTAGTTAQGTTLEGLQQAAQKLGLKAEGVQVNREALPDVSCPAIAWDRRHHFLMLRSLFGEGEQAVAVIHDPNKSAEEKISQENLLQRSGGYLLLIHR